MKTKTQMTVAIAVTLILSAASAVADETKDKETNLSKMTIHDAEAGYSQPNAATATKTDTPILLTPVSIQTVPLELIQDQQSIRLDRALENVSGVFGGKTSAGDAAVFIIRGFANPNVYKDGVRLPGDAGTGAPHRDLANIESVEVLKGPAAILYGRIDPGGMVNLLTKQPLSTSQYSLQQQIGSYGRSRTTADATGTLDGSESLTYRLNVDYESNDSYRQFMQSDRVFVAPTVRLQLSPQTQFTLEFEHLDSHDGLDGGVPILGNRPVAMKVADNSGEALGQFHTLETRVGVHWSHAFNDAWQVNQRVDWQRQSIAYDGFIYPVAVEDPDNCNVNGCNATRLFFGNYGPGHQLGETKFTDINLTGHFSTGALAHTLLIGGDYTLSKCCSDGKPGVFLSYDVDVPTIDLYHPVHTGFPSALRNAIAADGAAALDALVNDPTQAYKYGSVSKSWGIYAQDQVKLPHDVYVLAGLRYDKARDEDEQYGNVSADDSAVSPRVGVLWQPIPQWSLYAHYVKNFGTSNARTADGNFAPPQKATEYEVGVKTELLERRVVASLAAYQLTKQNIAIADPNPVLAAQNYVVTVGESRSRGLEFDISAELLKGWKLIGTYSRTDAEITKDRGVDTSGVNPIVTAGNTGKRFFAVPRNGASVWTTYEINRGANGGFTVGGGAIFRDQAEGDVGNTFQIPGYALASVMAKYQWRVHETRLSAQVNVENLFGHYYFSQDPYYAGVTVGAPRTVVGSLRVDF